MQIDDPRHQGQALGIDLLFCRTGYTTDFSDNTVLNGNIRDDAWISQSIEHLSLSDD
jgi:hypothetical protein